MLRDPVLEESPTTSRAFDPELRLKCGSPVKIQSRPPPGQNWAEFGRLHLCNAQEINLLIARLSWNPAPTLLGSMRRDWGST
mmetsp:Transcript_3677/g.8667  ORF Transcript_3677/g.8667 Transcript_3677/m.8667 type:complete len:82 (-) Transcript_3677:700-945(-)